MTPETVAAALASNEVEDLRATVRAVADALRTGDERTDRLGLAAALLPLARHASGKVRQTLAEACDAFPDPFFERALEALACDSNQYVRDAAERAGERRAVTRKRRTKDTERERVLVDLLGEIEEAHGKAARRLAERAVRRGVEHFVGQLDHELGKSDGALDHALAALRSEIEKPDASSAALARHAAALRGHFTHFRAVVRRSRECVAVARPAFAEESLGALVQETRARLIDHLGEQGARVDFVADVDPALRVLVDRHALVQALDNLVQNAAEAYPAGSPRLTVRVGARLVRAGSQVEIRIADGGQGMTETEKARLFVPFGSSKPGGTGVGMLIVRKMIEEVHGGEIAIETAVDRGTTVTLLLPVRKARPRK